MFVIMTFPTELLYEQAYWEFIIGHPCHADLPSHAEEDAISALTWLTQGNIPAYLMKLI